MTTQLEQALGQYRIKTQDRVSIRTFLEILQEHDEPTYQHCLRVGLLAATIVESRPESRLDPKILLCAGFLHDIGKALIDPDLLGKTNVFTEEDYRRIELHVEYGWRLLLYAHNWTAHIIVRHHRFGKRPYPAVLPPLPRHLKGREALINRYARILALADFYDALIYRKNQKFGGETSPEEKRAIFHHAHPDDLELIDALEVGNIFTYTKSIKNSA